MSSSIFTLYQTVSTASGLVAVRASKQTLIMNIVIHILFSQEPMDTIVALQALALSLQPGHRMD